MEMDPQFDEKGADQDRLPDPPCNRKRDITTMLSIPRNSNSRKVFAELTGQKLPPGVSKTRNFFQGQTVPGRFREDREAPGEKTPDRAPEFRSPSFHSREEGPEAFRIQKGFG